MTARRWTDAETQRLVALVEDGATLRQMVAALTTIQTASTVTMRSMAFMGYAPCQPG